MSFFASASIFSKSSSDLLSKAAVSSGVAAAAEPSPAAAPSGVVEPESFFSAWKRREGQVISRREGEERASDSERKGQVIVKREGTKAREGGVNERGGGGARERG